MIRFNEGIQSRMLREFATTLYPRSRNDRLRQLRMPCEPPVTMTVFCFQAAISASLAVDELFKFRRSGNILVRPNKLLPFP